MKKTIALLTVVVALLVVPFAGADSSTMLDGYAGLASKPVVQVKGATGEQVNDATSAPKPSPAGTLPFTGSDLVVFMAAGVALVGAGFALRRVGRDNR